MRLGAQKPTGNARDSEVANSESRVECTNRGRKTEHGQPKKYGNRRSAGGSTQRTEHEQNVQGMPGKR